MDSAGCYLLAGCVLAGTTITVGVGCGAGSFGVAWLSTNVMTVIAAVPRPIAVPTIHFTRSAFMSASSVLVAIWSILVSMRVSLFSILSSLFSSRATRASMPPLSDGGPPLSNDPAGLRCGGAVRRKRHRGLLAFLR